MQTRTGHYMPPALLASQFSALESPTDAITVSIEQTQDEIVAAINRQLPPA
jgi:gluconate kinase